MGKRSFILATALLAFLNLSVLAQQSAQPGPGDLKAVLQDDTRFSQLMTEVWVLRDILAIDLGGNISAEAQEFQGLQDRLREQRATIMEKLGSEPFPQTIIASADRYAAALEKTGVRRDSDLGKRLVMASILFEQAARVGTLGSLCDLHPFRAVCSEQ